MMIIIYIEILFYAKNYKLLLQGLLFPTVYFSVIYGIRQSVPPDFSTISRFFLQFRSLLIWDSAVLVEQNISNPENDKIKKESTKMNPALRIFKPGWPGKQPRV